jgi:hypothetical protein
MFYEKTRKMWPLNKNRWLLNKSDCMELIQVWLYKAGVNKSPSPTPGASNFHIWASWNNQLYARRASKNIYQILTNLSIFRRASKNIYSRHLLKLFYDENTQFFYLLCSQFRQKASGWINKTLLLIKQHITYIV